MKKSRRVSPAETVEITDPGAESRCSAPISWRGQSPGRLLPALGRLPRGFPADRRFLLVQQTPQPLFAPEKGFLGDHPAGAGAGEIDGDDLLHPGGAGGEDIDPVRQVDRL